MPRLGSPALIGNVGSTPNVESSSVPGRVGVAEPDPLRLPPPTPTGGEGHDSRVSEVVGTVEPGPKTGMVKK